MLFDMLRESLENGDSPQLVVTSNSMAPLIWQGDNVSLEAIEQSDLQRGDILTFVVDDELFTHRLWDKVMTDGVEKLLTRGDRPFVFDAPFAFDCVVGRVNGRYRNNSFLNLKQGSGLHLNQRLFKLAKLEYNLVAKRDFKFILYRRIIRKLVWLWARLITR